MQQVAEAWLVLQLTNSAFYLGLNGFANTIPLALFAFWGGVIADQADRRRLLMGTQWAMGLLAFTLAVWVQFGTVTVHGIIFLSFVAGLVQALAWPTYQSVLANIVSAEELPNAIALNSTQFNVARTIGPIAGAWGLAHFGSAGCFYVNALSFLFVIAALWQIRERHQDRRQATRGGLLDSFKEGIIYMRSEKRLLWFLSIMAMTSIFGVPLVTMLPVFARDILQVGVRGYGTLVGSFGAGAIVAGLVVAWLGHFKRRGRFVMVCLAFFATAMILFTLCRTYWVSVLLMAVGGFSMVGYASLINTLVQSTAPDHLRGRAMSLFVVAFGGFMPVGNLLAGALARHLGAPEALLIQGVVLAVFWGFLSWKHSELYHA